MTLDTPNAFVQMKVEDPNKRIILVLRGTAADILIGIAPEIHSECTTTENGKSVLCLECANATHGTLMAALSFHKQFFKNLKAQGFEMNPHD